jgi:hypothetical protein
VYQVVERPARLVFDALGAHGTVAIAARGGRTELVVTIRSPSAEHFETFRAVGVGENTGRTLDNLVRLLVRAR